MKIFGQLESACIEQLSSDPGTNVQGRVFANTTDGKIKYDDGTNKRALIKNDEHAIIGNSGTAANNVRLHRSGAGIFQFVSATDAAADGSGGSSLAQLSARLENYLSSGKPTAGQIGRSIYLTDTKTISIDDGAAWNDVLTQDLATTKGDLLVRSSSVISRLGIGSDGQVLTADSGQSLGMKWQSISTPPTTSHSVAYTAAIGDGLSVNDMGSGLPYTITLPSASSHSGERLRFKYISSSYTTASPILTIGSVTAMHGDGETLSIISDGTNWIVEYRQIQSVWITLSSGEWSTSGWSSLTSKQAAWRRVGSSIHVRGYFTGVAASASAASIFLNSIPGIDMTNAQAQKIIVGNWVTTATGGLTAISSANRHGPMAAASNTGAVNFIQSGTSANLQTANGNSIAGSNDGIHFEFIVPVVGWNG